MCGFMQMSELTESGVLYLEENGKQISLLGNNLVKLNSTEYISQYPKSIPGSVYEFLTTTLIKRNLLTTEIEQAMRTAGIQQKFDRILFSKFSSLPLVLQLQLQIAKGFLFGKKIFIIDQPFLRKNKAEFHKLEETLLIVKERNVLIISTQTPESAKNIADKVGYMEKSQLFELGNWAKTIKNPATESFYNYLHQ